MILKNEVGTVYMVSCDGCPEWVETETTIFKNIMTVLKEHGWVVQMNGDGVWNHYCPLCKEKK